MSSLLVAQLAAFAIGMALVLLYQRRSSANLPPGPRPLPFVGNIKDLPPPGRAEYLHWLTLKDAYGPLSSITVLGQPMIIIHDRIAADVLLEKTSLKTSGRPALHFATECGFGEMLPARQYGLEAKRHRKHMHQQFGTLKAASQFNNVQDVESRRLLFRALVDQENLMNHFKKEASAIILNITYGYAPEPHKTDPLVSMVEKMMDNFSSALVPLSRAVDIVPRLRYLPDWLPGMGYKKVAQAWYRLNRAVYDAPFSLVQRQMAAGANRPSYVSSLIEKLSDDLDGKLSKSDEDMIKETAAILYGGGADTTISTLNSFILAMLLFPDVQRKAQKEIDDVVGTGRLPGFEDRENLPYVRALVKESLRWFPVAPIGTHAVDAEFTYEGFRIPKGAYLVTSIWWLLHDPDVYHEPSSFDPSRFLQPRDEPDPAKHAFGWGRRICPGRFLSMESLYITISRFLAVFDITRAVDGEGRELEIRVEHTAGLISHPTPYPYAIKARSAAHEELIRSIEIDHPWETSDAQYLDVDTLEV